MLVSVLLDVDRPALLKHCEARLSAPRTLLGTPAVGAGTQDTSIQIMLGDAQPTLWGFVIQLQLCA